MYKNKPIVFTCRVCGKQGLDYSGGSKRYCSRRCREIAGYHVKGDPCKHNDGVSCAFENCGNCGWNPEVAKARLQKYFG